VTRAVVAAVALALLPAVLLAAVAGATAGEGDAGLLGRVGDGAVGVAAAAQQAGFAGPALRIAVAVALAESGGNPNARRPNPPTPGCPAGSVDRGPWQLNNCYHGEVPDDCAFDLACVAAATYRISAAGTDWTGWTTFTTGAYQSELSKADQAIASLSEGAIPPGYGTPGPCGLAPAADYTRHLVSELFGITDIGGCALFTGHIANSDHYPDANGQARAIDVMVGTDSALGAQVATWAAANATALQVKYVIFAGQIIDFRRPAPAWHACRDPSSSCAREHFDHVHISFLAQG
jgi:Lysozyme like domain